MELGSCVSGRNDEQNGITLMGKQQIFAIENSFSIEGHYLTEYSRPIPHGSARGDGWCLRKALFYNLKLSCSWVFWLVMETLKGQIEQVRFFISSVAISYLLRRTQISPTQDLLLPKQHLLSPNQDLVMSYVGDN